MLDTGNLSTSPQDSWDFWHLGAKNALSLPKKRTIKWINMVLPHQTHLGTENTLFLPKKKTPNQINDPWFATPNAHGTENTLFLP